MKTKAQKYRRSKQLKEDSMWDCTVCTYKNPPEAFKCLMCDVRKGTSTRKPRLNAELVAAQAAQVIPPKPKRVEKKEKETKREWRSPQKSMPRHTNVDRSTAEHNAVTVNNVTVIITEYQPKKKTTTGNGNTANTLSSSDAGSFSDASTDTRNDDTSSEPKNS